MQIYALEISVEVKLTFLVIALALAAELSSRSSVLRSLCVFEFTMPSIMFSLLASSVVIIVLGRSLAAVDLLLRSASGESVGLISIKSMLKSAA